MEVSKMSKNGSLQAAKNAKQDEFYTHIQDIKKELQHYTQHFKGKVVYCNCDADWSNFWKFFYDNFHKLGLRKLIATHYEQEDQAYKLEYDGKTVTKTALVGNGDFGSPECISLLNEADICCTNPPFSLYRSFIAQLTDHNKKFLVIASTNAITYKEFFPLLKDNKVWMGNNAVKEFTKPDGTMQTFGNICWYTNLDIDKRHEELVLTETYNSNNYPKYDNYDAIECGKVANIPADYFPCWYLCDKASVCEYAQKGGIGNCSAPCDCEDSCNGVIGVPITFLDRYSPDQFEIVGNLGSYGVDGYSLAPAIYVDGDKVFKRIAIRRKCNGVIGVPITFLDKHSAEQFELIGHEHNLKGDGSDGVSGGQFEVDGDGVYKRILIQRKCNGMMGVPITFLDKYNPDEFDIVGCSSELAEAIEINGKTKENSKNENNIAD